MCIYVYIGAGRDVWSGLGVTMLVGNGVGQSCSSSSSSSSLLDRSARPDAEMFTSNAGFTKVSPSKKVKEIRRSLYCKVRSNDIRIGADGTAVYNGEVVARSRQV